MIKIFITGASGFLADKIYCELIKNENFQLTLGTRQPDKLRQLPQFKNSNNIVEFDICNNESFKQISNHDVVIHLAQLDNQQCISDPKLAEKVNVDQVENLVKFTNSIKLHHFIFISTVHVYGSNLSGLINENTQPKPESIYAKTHLAAEDKILQSNAEKITILRLSNTIGHPPTLDSSAWKLVAMDLCLQVIKSGKIQLGSSGTQYRDFICVSEVGKTIEKLVAMTSLSHLNNSIFNLSSGKSITILELCEVVKNRALNVLKKDIELTIPSSACEKNSSTSKYTISRNKLDTLGITIESQISDEIDEILKKLAVNENNL